MYRPVRDIYTGQDTYALPNPRLQPVIICRFFLTINPNDKYQPVVSPHLHLIYVFSPKHIGDELSAVQNSFRVETKRRLDKLYHLSRDAVSVFRLRHMGRGRGRKMLRDKIKVVLGREG